VKSAVSHFADTGSGKHDFLNVAAFENVYWSSIVKLRISEFADSDFRFIRTFGAALGFTDDSNRCIRLEFQSTL